MAAAAMAEWPIGPKGAKPTVSSRRTASFDYGSVSVPLAEVKYIDGSIHSDLPTQQLAELFRCVRAPLAAVACRRHSTLRSSTQRN